MSFEAQCPQCRFVSQQLGQPTPCLLHVSTFARADQANQAEVASLAQAPRSEDYDEPYAFGERRPTVDRPGPFTVREYVRLQLLRVRVQADPSPFDTATTGAHVRTLSRR